VATRSRRDEIVPFLITEINLIEDEGENEYEDSCEERKLSSTTAWFTSSAARVGF
jgi:hypothetical protein